MLLIQYLQAGQYITILGIKAICYQAHQKNICSVKNFLDILHLSPYKSLDVLLLLQKNKTQK